MKNKKTKNVATKVERKYLIDGLKNKYKRFFADNKHNFFINFIIIIALLSFWFLASLFFIRETSFAVLDVVLWTNSSTSAPAGKLLKGEKIVGQFKSPENFLGIVKVRFKDFVKVDFKGEDVLQFRIKEKGSKDWYYFNNYRSGLLENHLLFPFGFPVITYSKNKFYVFEIESLFGTVSNAVTPDTGSPIITGHQFTKKETFGGKKRILIFFYKKIISSFTNPDFLLQSIFFLTPLIVYVLLRTLGKKYLKKEYLSIPLFILFTVDIFMLKEFYIGIWLFGFFIILVYYFFYGLKANQLITMALMLSILWIFLIPLRYSTIEMKINIWVYTLLVLGICKIILEEINVKTNK